jgi:hypothetical protein
MAKDEAMVRVPEAMYRQLERRAMRATELEETLISKGELLRPYTIITVITSPPSAENAASILMAVQQIVQLATTLEGK